MNQVISNKKRCMSFILGCMISAEAGLLPQTFAANKVDSDLAPQKNVSTASKIKNVSKKVALAPIKASWWFVKNNLKAAGMGLLDVSILCGVIAYTISSYVSILEGALEKIDDDLTLEDYQRDNLKGWVSEVCGNLNIKNPQLAAMTFASHVLFLQAIEDGKFEEAYKSYMEIHGLYDITKRANILLDDTTLNTFNEKINAIQQKEDESGKKELADELRQWVHNNMIQCYRDGRRITDTLSKDYKHIEFLSICSDLQQFIELYGRLQRLNADLRQYSATQQLVGEFNVIRNNLKKEYPQAFNANSAGDGVPLDTLPSTMGDVD